MNRFFACTCIVAGAAFIWLIVYVAFLINAKEADKFLSSSDVANFKKNLGQVSTKWTYEETCYNKAVGHFKPSQISPDHDRCCLDFGNQISCNRLQSIQLALMEHESTAHYVCVVIFSLAICVSLFIWRQTVKQFIKIHICKSDKSQPNLAKSKVPMLSGGNLV